MNHRYIYKLYRASDGRYNIEKKPVIYENSKYIYFKPFNNAYCLEYIPINDLIESIHDVDNTYFNVHNDYYTGCRYIKYYNKNKDKEILDKRVANIYKSDIERDLDDTNREIEYESSKLNNLIKRKNELELKLKKY